jgi:hypothetical protein
MNSFPYRLQRAARCVRAHGAAGEPSPGNSMYRYRTAFFPVVRLNFPVSRVIKLPSAFITKMAVRQSDVPVLQARKLSSITILVPLRE